MATTADDKCTVLSTNDLHFLLTSLWSVRGKWYYFGLALGFPDTDLDAIHKCDNSPDDCLKNVLKKWLHSGHPAKMSVLIKALKSPTVGHEQLADTLLKNFLITADSKCENKPAVVETSTAMQVSTMTTSNTDNKIISIDHEHCQLTIPEHMEDLKYQIEVDLDKIEKEFANVVTGVRMSLKRRKIFAADIVAHVIQYQCISDTNKEKLKEENSLDVVFIVISGYWSFLECDILESIVTNYGTDEDHDKMERYKKKLECFCRRRLSEVPGGQLHLKGSSESHERQSMIVKLDIHDHTRLSAIKEMKLKLCKILSIVPTTIEIKCICQGCVEITFLIPQCIAKALFEIPLTKAQVDALQAMSVVRITCGNFDKLFNSTEDSTVTKQVVIDGDVPYELSPISNTVSVHTNKEAKQLEDLATAEGLDQVDTDRISHTLSEAAVDLHLPVLVSSLKHSKFNSAGAGNEPLMEQEAVEPAADLSKKRRYCYDSQVPASYEHRKLLSQLSDMLSETELAKIVFYEALPKGLLGDENKYPDPLDIMMHLQMQGKTTPEELTRILSDINRQDLVKLVAKSTENPLTRKSSGPSSPKLEDTFNLTVKCSDFLLEHVELLLKHAASKDKRIEDMVSEAKTNLIVVQRKLKYASGFLLSSQYQNEHCGNVGNPSSHGSSPESSLTLNVHQSDPSGCGHQHPQINDGKLKRAFEKLKPPGVAPHRAMHKIAGAVSPRMSRQLQDNSSAAIKQTTPTQNTQKGKVNPSSPTNSSRNSSDNEDDIYTLPGPVKITALSTQTSDVTYYNYPVRDHQPLSRSGSENRSGKALLVTGSTKTAKPGPTTKPKPLKGKSHTTVQYTTGKVADDVPPADDYSCSTYSYTGDSGFSDSREFLKESPPSSPQHIPAQIEHVLGSDASYAPLIKADVRSTYYKSLNRENIPEAIYDTTD